MKRILITFALLLLFSIPLKAADFKYSYALVVGVNDYSSQQLESLKNAEADALAVSKYLKSQGYITYPLIGNKDGTKENVERTIDTLAKIMLPNSRFLFFFAGHGKNDFTEGVDVAYLVLPSNSKSENSSALISSGDISRYSRKLGSALHQLFIFDSCYSGLIGTLDVRSINSKPKYDSETYLLKSLRSRKVRQFLAAGGAYQEVLDGGPHGISWFTYFLLKALEPNHASSRQSGLITFSEFASFVQTRSANPRHTPAFGSLSGHGGGEYLFRDISKGTPPLLPLPTISANTLYDLGFVTRKDDQDSVTKSLAYMKEPIENLYRAWRTLDIELYLDQFDPMVIQTRIYKSGRTYNRKYKDIEKNRRKLFPLLKSVDVTKFELMYQGFRKQVATFGVRYSMTFNWKSGKVTKEININECYQVAQNPTDKKWRIVRNDDYQKALCSLTNR